MAQINVFVIVLILSFCATYSVFVEFELVQLNVILRPNLIVEVVVALVHLLQSEAPLVLHMDVGVELPLCSLHQLTHTHTHIYSYTHENRYSSKPFSATRYKA